MVYKPCPECETCNKRSGKITDESDSDDDNDIYYNFVPNQVGPSHPIQLLPSQPPNPSTVKPKVGPYHPSQSSSSQPPNHSTVKSKVGAHLGSMSTPEEHLDSVMPPPPQTYRCKRKSKQAPLSEISSHIAGNHLALSVTRHSDPLQDDEAIISFDNSQGAALLPSATIPPQFCEVVQRPNVLQAHPLQLQQGITATIFQNSLTTPEVRPYPEPPRFTTLMNELINRVAAKWEEIGFSLRLESGLLEIIKKDNPSDCRACLREMLKEWMKQVDPPPSWSAIIKAVKDCGYRPLARTLKEKYLLSTGYATLS